MCASYVVLKCVDNISGNKRKNANNGNALGGSNNFFADL